VDISKNLSWIGYAWICMDFQDGYPIQYNKSDMFRWRPRYIHGYPWISMDIHGYPTYPYISA
jgi:hypothetical protein